MAESSKPKETAAVTLKASTEVNVSLLPFQLLSSVQFLDAEALARSPQSKIEIGTFEGGCCARHVRALVEAGMVTGLEVDACGGSKPPPSELVPVLKTALKKLGRSAPKPWKPVPVAKFLAQPQEITVSTITCIRICIWSWCIVCCTTQIPGTPFWCGDRVIIQRDP